MTFRKRRLYAAVILAEIGYGMFILVASLLAVRVIGSPFVLGLTGTVHVGTRVVGNFLFGRLSDRIGCKALMLASCALSIVAFLLLGIGTPAGIFAAYFVSGVGNSIFWPLVEAWIGRGNHDKNLMTFLGTFGACFTGGIALGNLCGGFVMKLAPVGPIVLGCMLLAVVAGLIYRTPDGEVSVGAQRPTGSTEADGVTLMGGAVDSSALRRQFMYAGWVANFATWSAIGIIRFLFNKLCVEIGMPSAVIGLVNTVLYTCWMTMFLILLRHRAWVYRLSPLLLLQGLGVAALVLLGLWPSRPMAFFVFGLFGFCAGMTYFSSVFYGQNGSIDRGNKSGLHEMILGSGMLIGPFVGGAIAEVFSLQAPFLFAAGLIVAAMVLETAVTRPARRAHATSS